MKVLIIEDDEPVTELLQLFLAPLTTEIIVAHNMTDALQAIEHEKEIFMITLDLGLPDSTVESTVEKIKQIKESSEDVMVVVVTGNDYPGLRDKVMKAGADGFILKQDDRFTPEGFLKLLGDIAGTFLTKPRKFSDSVKCLETVSHRLTQLTTTNP